MLAQGLQYLVDCLLAEWSGYCPWEEEFLFSLWGGSFFLFFSASYIFTANFTTGPQSFTEGPLINTMSRASRILFYNEFLHLVFTSFIETFPPLGPGNLGNLKQDIKKWLIIHFIFHQLGQEPCCRAVTCAIPYFVWDCFLHICDLSCENVPYGIRSNV